MNLAHLNTAQRLSAGSIGVVVIAAFLPWVSIFGVSASGLEGDGVITLIVGLAGGALLAVSTGLFSSEQKTPTNMMNIVQIVLAGVTALIGLIDMNGAAAIGLYLTMFAGLAWVGGAVWQLTLAKQDGSASAAPPADES